MILLKLVVIIVLWYIGIVPSGMCLMATVMALSDAPGKRKPTEIILGIAILSLIPIYYIGVVLMVFWIF